MADPYRFREYEWAVYEMPSSCPFLYCIGAHWPGHVGVHPTIVAESNSRVALDYLVECANERTEVAARG